MNKLAYFFLGLFLVVLITVITFNTDTNIDPNSQLTGPINSSIIQNQDIPEATGFVNDYGNIINEVIEARLESTLKLHSESNGTEIAILTVNSMNGLTIEEYGIRVGEKWKVGKNEIDNGAIIIIAVSERKVRIEVGRGLNITDAQAGQILDEKMIPFLKNNKWEQAIEAGINELILRTTKE